MHSETFSDCDNLESLNFSDMVTCRRNFERLGKRRSGIVVIVQLGHVFVSANSAVAQDPIFCYSTEIGGH